MEEDIRWGIFAVDEEGFEQVDRIDHLSFGGREQGQVDRQVLSAFQGSASKRYFPENHGQSQGAFRVVIGRLHSIDFQEGEQAIAVALEGRERGQSYKMMIWVDLSVEGINLTSCHECLEWNMREGCIT